MKKDKRFRLSLAEVRSVSEADERNELKNEMDKWFNNLTVNQRLDLARDMWDRLDFEGKKEEYYID